MGKEIASTILEQLGGNKFVVMTGSKNFLSLGNGLQMSLARNKTRANRLTITLSPDDTYVMQFKYVAQGRFNSKTLKWSEPKNQVLRTYEGVYCDMLQDLFTEYTGLYTHF